jgi:hypothetical protein
VTGGGGEPPPHPANIARLAVLQTKTYETSRFSIGDEVVEPYGERGRIDVIFADLDAAISSFVVKDGWYEGQERPPKTPKTGFWYSVITARGACLVGEDDLVSTQ